MRLSSAAIIAFVIVMTLTNFAIAFGPSIARAAANAQLEPGDQFYVMFTGEIDDDTWGDDGKISLEECAFIVVDEDDAEEIIEDYE